jgi:hypothetical protein
MTPERLLELLKLIKQAQWVQSLRHPRQFLLAFGAQRP